MPDFTIVNMQQCKQLETPVIVRGSGGKTYTVDPGNERRMPSCTCPAYQYGKRVVQFGGEMYPADCKHIRAHVETMCTWHELSGPERAIVPEDNGNEPVCPRCGGPTMWVQVAV